VYKNLTGRQSVWGKQSVTGSESRLDLFLNHRLDAGKQLTLKWKIDSQDIRIAAQLQDGLCLLVIYQAQKLIYLKCLYL
jgi:hypothetical protein